VTADAKRKRSTPKRRRAARQNGARSSGRPRGKLPREVIDRLGPPPADANALRAWNGRVLAEVQWLVAQGAIGVELAASLRAGAGAIDRAVPEARNGDEDDTGDDDDDAFGDGPELEDVDDQDEEDPKWIRVE